MNSKEDFNEIQQPFCQEENVKAKDYHKNK